MRMQTDTRWTKTRMDWNPNKKIDHLEKDEWKKRNKKYCNSPQYKFNINFWHFMFEKLTRHQKRTKDGDKIPTQKNWNFMVENTYTDGKRLWWWKTQNKKIQRQRLSAICAISSFSVERKITSNRKRVEILYIFILRWSGLSA